MRNQIRTLLVFILLLLVQNINAQNKFIPSVNLGVGFLDGGNKSFRATIGTNYFITNNIYVGGQIGYSLSDFDVENKDMWYESQSHFINIPLEAGICILPNNKDFDIAPIAGVEFNVGLRSKYNYSMNYMNNSVGGHENISLKAKTGIGFITGARIHLAGFSINGIYHIPLNDKQKSYFGDKAYLEISLGYALKI